MIKKWIIKLGIKFLKEIDDADLKREILTEAVKKLYNSIGPDDILKQNPDGTWTFQDRPITQTEVEQLRAEARVILGMKLWRAIKLDIRYQIGKKVWEEANCMDDILWGKLLTYLDDIIRTRLQRMK